MEDMIMSSLSVLGSEFESQMCVLCSSPFPKGDCNTCDECSTVQKNILDDFKPENDIDVTAMHTRRAARNINTGEQYLLWIFGT